MIPKVVHRVWLGGDEPDWTRPFADTWRRPGWELRQWTDANVGELFPLRNQAIWDKAEEVAPRHVGQLRVDVLRYELLFRFGGVYVDADAESLRPLDPLLDVECFAGWEKQHRWVGNTILGAVRGHRFMDVLIRGLAGNVRRHRGARPNVLTGPQYLTHQWRLHGKDVTVYPQSHFYPFSYRDVDRYPIGSEQRFPRSYSAHWWSNRRRERGLLHAT